MGLIKATTASGSVYYIDYERSRFLKIPSRENPFWALEAETWYPFGTIAPIELGKSILIDGSYWTVSTTVVSIEEVEEDDVPVYGD